MGQRTRLGGLTLALTMVLTWPALPASAASGHPDAEWLDVQIISEGVLEPISELAAPPPRDGHGTMTADFEDEPWTWQASGTGSCTEINVELVAAYPPRPGDWATARVTAIADDTVRNFCVPGTRPFHGTGTITGGGGNYADSEGDFTFTGTVTGGGGAVQETIRMVSTGRLRCYHVGSVDDRVEHHH